MGRGFFPRNDLINFFVNFAIMKIYEYLIREDLMKGKDLDT